MTREEAITIIDNLHLIGCGRNQHEDDLRRNVALDMAIEALQADTVSREDTVTLNSPISIQAEMVAVVRCKDCKWAEKAILDEYCVECTMYHTSCMRHGYCHHGERREP